MPLPLPLSPAMPQPLPLAVPLAVPQPLPLAVPLDSAPLETVAAASSAYQPTAARPRLQKAAAAPPKKLPAAAWRALQSKRPLEEGVFTGYGSGFGSAMGAYDCVAPAKRHLSRMDAAEQAVRMLRHDLEALRTDMQQQINQLHDLVRLCVSSSSAAASSCCILEPPEYAPPQYETYTQPPHEVADWEPQDVLDFSMPFEQHLLATEEYHQRV